MGLAVQRVGRFVRRPLADKVLVVEAYVLLGVTRVLVRFLPFRQLERLLGTRLAESPTELGDAERIVARRVVWAVRGVHRYTPWKSDCFPQALTAKLMLRRRGVASTLYLGVAFTQSRADLMAHAWLRCGGIYVGGGPEANRGFGAVASFA